MSDEEEEVIDDDEDEEEESEAEWGSIYTDDDASYSSASIDHNPILDETIKWEDKTASLAYSLQVTVEQVFNRKDLALDVEGTLTCHCTSPITRVESVDMLIYEYLEGEEIGFLKASLVPRPQERFYHTLSNLGSSELLSEMARDFFDYKGRLVNLMNHPELRDIGEELTSGGYLFVLEVEIKDDHSGRDLLRIRMLHETLALLSQKSKENNDSIKWTFAVANSHPANRQCYSYPRQSRERGYSAADNSGLQLARLTFARVSTYLDEDQELQFSDDVWFLTNRMHDNLIDQLSSMNDLSRNQFSLSRAETTANIDTLSRQNFHDASAVQIVEDIVRDYNWRTYTVLDDCERTISEIQHRMEDPWASPQLRQQNSLALDAEETVHAELKQELRYEFISAMQVHYLDAGHSLEGTRALHYGMGLHKKTVRAIFIQVLLELGADCNTQDEIGVTPLHLAVQLNDIPVIRILINHGADQNLRDNMSRAPLDYTFLLIHRCQVSRSVRESPRALVSEASIMPYFETIQALLSESQKGVLIDGWLSPRLTKMLLTTAQLELENLRENIDAQPEGLENMSIEQFKATYRRMEYTPVWTMQFAEFGGVFSSRDQYFWNYLEMTRIAWQAVLELLEEGMAPTARVVTERAELLLTPEQRQEEEFEFSGCKVIYVLDALLTITENIWNGETDGWRKDSIQTDLNALSETPLDGLYDIAWIMLVKRDEAHHCWYKDERRGPHTAEWTKFMNSDPLQN
jgi:hypothetical protein